MLTGSADMVLMDAVTLCLGGFFGCLIYMILYLRKHIDERLQEKVRHAIWLENIFYFRDYTKKKFGRPHSIYYLATFLAAVVLGVFCLKMYDQLTHLAPLYRYPLMVVVGIVVILVLGLIWRLRGKTYYE
ncbi:MAG: hypothetical protein ACK5PS_13350 [Desulfopila sp.]